MAKFIISTADSSKFYVKESYSGYSLTENVEMATQYSRLRDVEKFKASIDGFYPDRFKNLLGTKIRKVRIELIDEED